MKTCLLVVQIRYEQDIVLARQRARQTAALLGFKPQAQVRIATAVSEIARNVFRYAGGGTMELCVVTEPTPTLRIVFNDQGPGIANLQTILDGNYVSKSGMGLGILGAKKLMDQFEIATTSKGTTVVLGRFIPKEPAEFHPAFWADLAQELSRQTIQEPFFELQQQNQELLAAFSELELRQTELARLNLALEEAKRQLSLHNELLESRVLERTAELKASLHQMDRFCYSIAHDLKAPLRAINGLTVILQQDYASAFDDAGKDCTQRIIQAATRMDDLIADLLEYGRLTHMEVVCSSVNLSGEIEKLLQERGRDILFQNATIEVQAGLPNVLANPALLQQALSNLIDNGLKFVAAGVKPSLSIWSETGNQQTKARSPIATTRLCIKDNGIGIAAEYENRIFKVFERLHPEDSAYPGTGIGLALVQKAMERMNGSVGVESDAGKGSIFWIELPTPSSEHSLAAS